MEFNNLSNGKSDGFALFYLKDGILNTVMLKEDQATALDLLLNVVFENGKVKAIVDPADYDVIVKMLKKK